MKTEGQLLVELSMIQGKRHTREIRLRNDYFDYQDHELVQIVRDNWETDEESNKRYFMSGE